MPKGLCLTRPHTPVFCPANTTDFFFNLPPDNYESSTLTPKMRVSIFTITLFIAAISSKASAQAPCTASAGTKCDDLGAKKCCSDSVNVLFCGNDGTIKYQNCAGSEGTGTCNQTSANTVDCVEEW